jgi:tetratricopeptide (TPR) repeat protein
MKNFVTNLRLQALILACFSLLLYGQTLRFDYVLDDGEMVVRQPSVVKGLAGIPEILTTATTFTGTFEHNNQKQEPHASKQRSAYRPLSLVTFAVEYQFAENNAVLRHAVNTILYALAVVVVFGVFIQLCASIHALLPFLAALIFAAHPLHAEVVCNIKSRDELLALLFAVSALWLVLRYAQTRDVKSLLGAFAAFFLALLSKENAVTMLPVFPLAMWIVKAHKPDVNTDIKRIGAAFGGMAVVALVWLLLSLRIASWGVEDANFASLLNNPYANAAQEQLLPTKIAVLGENILKLAFPLTLSYDYGYRVIEPIGWGVQPFVALALILALLAHGVWYIRAKDQPGNRSALGLLWMFAAMSIASNLVVYSGSAMADRFMFLPSVAWCLALGTGTVWFLQRFKISSFEKAFLVLLGAIALAYSARTLVRVPDWKTSYDLAASATRATPRSIKAHAAFVLESLLKFKDEKDSLQRSAYLGDVYASASALTNLAPAYGRGYYTLALYFERYAPHKDTPAGDSAKKYFLEALTYEPKNREYKYDWAMFRGHKALQGVSEAHTALFDSAIAHYREALTYNITPYLAYANIGSAYAREQRYGEALPYLQKAVALNPNDNTLSARLALCSAQEAIERGNTELRANRLESALAAYQEATKFGAAADIAWLNVALVKSRQNKRSEALQAVQEALRLNPANGLAQTMLSQLQTR